MPKLVTSTLHIISLPTSIKKNYLNIQAGYESFVIKSSVSYIARFEFHLQSFLLEDTAHSSPHTGQGLETCS